MTHSRAEFDWFQRVRVSSKYEVTCTSDKAGSVDILITSLGPVFGPHYKESLIAEPCNLHFARDSLKTASTLVERVTCQHPQTFAAIADSRPFSRAQKRHVMA